MSLSEVANIIHTRLNHSLNGGCPKGRDGEFFCINLADEILRRTSHVNQVANSLRMVQFPDEETRMAVATRIHDCFADTIEGFATDGPNYEWLKRAGVW